VGVGSDFLAKEKILSTSTISTAFENNFPFENNILSYTKIL
jgi:hypothetical protein